MFFILWIFFTMNYEKNLTILLANFVALQYKFHSIHTSMKGKSRSCFHTMMDEVYQLFWDDAIDLIKERAEMMNMTTPSNLEQLLKVSIIKQLDTIPDTIKSKAIVLEDMKIIEAYIEWLLWKYNDDLQTQTMLLDLLQPITKMRWKLESTIL